MKKSEMIKHLIDNNWILNEDHGSQLIDALVEKGMLPPQRKNPRDEDEYYVNEWEHEDG